ncbi:TNF receptor-associated factor 2-like [Ornithodoros turicata]|uniref:TNF receptor-associated factor 2-like n=1 Tax=Ornithodoros turicata TaxID=34597 RepID=UPI003139B299
MCTKSYLLGHFEALDWRPLQFLGLPSTISCDLCSCVPEKIFRLECFHSLCEGCYQSVLRSNPRCPLDRQELHQSEVIILPIKTTSLQKLEVRCCNFKHGCPFVGSLERMKYHFLKDCEFHSLTCKNCSATVLRKDIISHRMEEECGKQYSQRGDVDIDSSVLVIGRGINTSMADISDKLHAIEDHLSSHTVGIDTTKECVVNYAQVLRTIQEELRLSTEGISNLVTSMHTVREALSSIEDQQSKQALSAAEVQNIVTSNRERLTVVVELQNEVAQNVLTSGERWKQCSGKLEAMSKRIRDHSSSAHDRLSTMRDMLQAPQAPIGYGTNVAFFHVTEVDDLQKKAIEEGLAYALSDVFALCGYSVKLSVYLKRYDGIMYIGAYLHIFRGPKDSLLKWPFLFPYKLILVHPTDDKRNTEYTTDVPNVFQETPESFDRPVESSNKGCGTPKLCKLLDAFNRGFVYKNSITVGVTLVQSRQ